jgi:hypothetical protein
LGRPVRLSVLLAPDVADALIDLAERRQTPISDAVRRAISLSYFADAQVRAGHKILVDKGKSLMEIELP